MPTINRCQTCELVARRDAGEAPLWDAIHRSQHWDVVHSYNTALPGWLVLVARRHMAAIDEMNDEEAADHPHVHFHVVPRMADQPEDRRSIHVFRYLGVSEEERVSEANMNELGAQIQRILLSL